ncbi:MAG: hypothetical protein ACFFEK_07325 [Candidatus Thorarchaeota archaeon]
MIEIYLYGHTKELVKTNIPEANTILLFDYVEGEHFQELLNRLGLKLDDVGNCYINNELAVPENELQDGDTIELNEGSFSV